jgi:hypothetical protein
MGKKTIDGLEVGKYYDTHDGVVQVIEMINSYEIKIRFVYPEWTTTVGAGDLRRGQVRNYLKPSVGGVGYIGEGPPVTKDDPMMFLAYNTWRGMIKRCYDPTDKFHIHNYKEVKVDEFWHNFRNFAIWYIAALSKLPPVDFTWQLDKDFLFPGNKIYGPDKCCLIPQTINALFADCERSRGKYPLGIIKVGSKYRASCRHPSKPRYIGMYSTILEAQLAYWHTKFDAIHQTTILHWNHLPEPLAMRLIHFGWKEANDYFGDDVLLRLD